MGVWPELDPSGREIFAMHARTFLDMLRQIQKGQNAETFYPQLVSAVNRLFPTAEKKEQDK